eukprot:TRINITY_DN2997_c0_g1_i1.p1 TRINITY_DN2997_c0_g1~~TRINITY_DN2997_c0_g1_i1.p1  ORF type:complete len:113 (-),score=1.41 TRINITY_DN2997_c0_g1_i1:233-571(-)
MSSPGSAVADTGDVESPRRVEDSLLHSYLSVPTRAPFIRAPAPSTGKNKFLLGGTHLTHPTIPFARWSTMCYSSVKGLDAQLKPVTKEAVSTVIPAAVHPIHALMGVSSSQD